MTPEQTERVERYLTNFREAVRNLNHIGAWVVCTCDGLNNNIAQTTEQMQQAIIDRAEWRLRNTGWSVEDLTVEDALHANASVIGRYHTQLNLHRLTIATNEMMTAPPDHVPRLAAEIMGRVALLEYWKPADGQWSYDAMKECRHAPRY
jgi:hypothetical protein